MDANARSRGRMPNMWEDWGLRRALEESVEGAAATVGPKGKGAHADACTIDIDR